jgi:hypothetical protein
MVASGDDGRLPCRRPTVAANLANDLHDTRTTAQAVVVWVRSVDRTLAAATGPHHVRGRHDAPASEPPREEPTMGKALFGTHTPPASLHLLDEVRSLRERVAELEAALAAAEALRAEQVEAEAARGDRQPAAN